MPPTPASETTVATSIAMRTPSALTLTSDALAMHIVRPEISPRSVQISNFWLRDHCRCTLCYNADTFQRKQNVLDIPIDIRPLRWEIVTTAADDTIRSHKSSANAVLRITWPDEHETVYDLDALYEQFAHDAAAKSLAASSTTRVLWSGTDIVGQPYARVQLNDLLCDDAVARSVVASLVRYGLAFIERVPANLHSTEVAVKRMFEPHKTLFGEMWSLSDNALHADSAYTREFLGAHTDNTYFNDAAGLQVLHCVQHCGTGGESLLVDGFRALTALRDRDAGAYDRLRTVDVPAEYVEKGQHHKYVAPIVRHTPGVVDGQLEQIRFNLYDRAPMPAMPPNAMRRFYQDLRMLSAEIRSPESEWWFKLRPGTVLIFDNWRLLHGRQAYTGHRQLVGCYVSRTEFQSVARTMGLID